ncbi:hypothetical protein RHSIM_Rhsim10G0054100 [Rhododendron simsii]|uniref:non-specific serine/threonine protein kinase n=1 Tax=Rhododendron simsii TaxID=118357 RepID=A0A834LAI9_RHOSS|nr:hypothetical protein RHSIM_Rhsim10G0054100 [Rhododendron simsii]
MYVNLLSFTIPLYLILNQILFSVATTNSPVHYHPLDNIAVDCGSSGNSTAVDGREWTGDIGSKYAPLLLTSNEGKLISSKAADQPLSPGRVPFGTARLSRSPFAYTFRVTPGQKFIRLHFYPASYGGGFKRSNAFFMVKAGPYTLLRNFSASLAVDALGLQSLVKEYCVTVEENQPLIIRFSPSLGGSSNEAYAFVNGIEIVSMPTGLYHTQEGDAGAHVVGENFRFPIGKSIALEMVQRLNIGGSSVSSIEDTGMFRDWSQDSNNLLEITSVQPVTTTLRIKYTSIQSYTAPQKVYQTSWSMVTDRQGNGTFNFTWKFPIDLGFRYLLRLHFCEFEYDRDESDHKKFSIFVNEHVADAKADVIKWSGGNRVAVYRDYLVMMEGDRMEGKHNLIITYFPHNNEWIEHIDTVLRGLEVFKLSNPDKNLAGVNPMPLARASISSNATPRRFVYASSGNTIATVLVILLSVLNILVYKLRVWGEKVGEKSISPLLSEGVCHRFSFSEVLSMTNNFDDELVIGSGGFGNVYKGFIDNGTTIVAIKRLKSKSNQGANEFWTEIEMLSNLRHMHLVSLTGYCDEGQEMILVYEYMEHGTLADHLYKHCNVGNGTICHLSWEQRMKICIGAARGLDYLHSGTRCGIIHRDVKTTNILLDKDWVAKISDFGLCKEGTTSHSHTHVSTDVKGTFGYLDPEYFLTRRLTKKSDVYAFGVVLLEVLCGRPAVDMRLEEEQRSLALLAQQCIKEEKLDQLIDQSLRDQISPKCLQVFGDVANKCLHSRPSGRPTMTDVVASLECMLADILPQGTAASPSTLVQYNENTQRKKRLPKRRGQIKIGFRGVLHFLARGSKSVNIISGSARKEVIIFTDIGVRLTFEDVVRATGSFNASNCIGSGGYSAIYKAEISPGDLVAIKRLAIRRFEGVQRFDAEIKTLGRLRHPNLVTLIGYHASETEMFLIYDYLPGGNLEKFIQERSTRAVDWWVLHKIALDIARALAYLHDQCVPRVLHRDVKPSNILLDDDYNAYLSDFGLARLLDTSETHATTGVAGTFGYVAPEYALTCRVSEKSDVYSYGVVLLRLISDKKAFDPSFAPFGNGFNNVGWASMLIRQGRGKEFVTAGLWDVGPHDDLVEVLHLALVCTAETLSIRPTMRQVVQRLKQLQPPSC